MRESNIHRFFAAVALCALVLASVSSAGADSIYLKNGRVIRTASARIEGDRVVFLQYGSLQSIPLAVVERVEDDDRVGPGHPEPTTPTTAGQGRAAGQGPSGADSSRGGGAGPHPGAGGGFPSGAAMGTPAERMEALSSFFSENSGGAVDPQQALGVLQALGGMSGGETSSGGLESMMGMLAAFGGLGESEGLTGANDLAVIQKVLPQLAGLAQALFAPEYDQENTQAAVANLMTALKAAGVSEAQIRQMAAQWGVPEEWFQQRR